MPNYADAVLVEAQARIQDSFQRPEVRLKANGSFTPFQRQTQLTVPNINDLRVSHTRPTDVNFFTRSKRAVTNNRVARHTGGQGDSSKLGLTWGIATDTASTSIKLAENTIWSDSEIVANEIDNMLKNIAEDVHDQSLIYLDANKTTQNAATQLGAFQAANNTFAISAPGTGPDLYFDNTKSMLRQNYYGGTADVVANSQIFSKATFLGNQGTGNQTNLGYQFGGLLINEAVGLSDANYGGGIGYFMPEGTIGAVDWTPVKNRENWGNLDSYVGGFRTISNPYLGGLSCALSAYMDRADASATGGNEQDVVIQWEISFEWSFVKAPIVNGAGVETTIFASGQLT